MKQRLGRMIMSQECFSDLHELYFRFMQYFNFNKETKETDKTIELVGESMFFDEIEEGSEIPRYTLEIRPTINDNEKSISYTMKVVRQRQYEVDQLTEDKELAGNLMINRE